MEEMEKSALSLPVEFHALHFDANEEEFYYDPEKLQHYDTGPEERLHLHKAALMVEDWIKLLAEQQQAKGQPLKDALPDQMPMMAAAAPEDAWKLGGQLSKEEKRQMVNFLETHKGAFAYSTADLGGFTGEAMEIPLGTEKPIFSHAHKLGKTEWDFVGEHCEKLAQEGLIRPSLQSKYASATVVLRKRDESGAYTDLRQCGDTGR
jgi:hypothetical protein